VIDVPTPRSRDTSAARWNTRGGTGTDLTFEVVVTPVSDVDHATAFYEKALGYSLADSPTRLARREWVVVQTQ
jgi:predicted enzyme related to lactoylglutathione lyase